MKTVQEIMAENGSLANIERFQTMQKWDYKRKVEHAQEMAEAFYYWAKEHDKGVHLSVGGLDSITLHYFLESIGLPVTCVSCSSLEGKGVQIRALGIIFHDFPHGAFCHVVQLCGSGVALQLHIVSDDLLFLSVCQPLRAHRHHLSKLVQKKNRPEIRTVRISK